MKKNYYFFLFAFVFMFMQSVSAQNYGLNFSSATTYAQVPIDPALDITGSITLEAWIYPTAWRTNVYEGCILCKEGISYQGYMLRAGAGGKLNFNIGTGTAWKEFETSAGTLVLNTWQHVAGVYDGTQMIIYVNGVQVGSPLAYTGTIAVSPKRFEIGRADQYNDRYFRGKIDEVRVWNIGISAADMLANYNQSVTAAHPNYANLVAYYEMDEIDTDTDADGNFDLVATVGPDGEVFGAPFGPACNGLFTSSAPAGSTTIEAYQSTTSPASLGGTNQHILKIVVDQFDDSMLSELVFQTNGTSDISDILNARVWVTTSPSFAPTTQFGATIDNPTPANTNMTFTGTTAIPCGTAYFWLTYDINPNATLDNLVDATFISATIDGAQLLPTTSDPIGSRAIAATCTHTLRITATTSGGWNGGLVDVIVNGSPVLTAIGSTFTSGVGPVDFTFNAGTADAISVVRTTAGTYPTRMRVQILDGNGTSVLAAIEPTTAGVTTTGYCGGFATTAAATLVTAYSAQLNGSYANCVPDESGFRYKKTLETVWNYVQDYNNPMEYDLQGLDPATNYHYKAFAVVGADTLWGATVNFATTCVPFTIPFAESFNATTLPLCWTNSSTNPFTFVTSGSYPTTSPFFGSGMAMFGGWLYYSGTEGYIATPELDNLTEGMEVRFWFHRQDYNPSYTIAAIKVYANNTNNTTGATLLTTIQRVFSQAPAVPSAGWYEYVATIPAGTFTHIIFQATSDYYANMFLDEVSVNYAASCPAPPAISLTTLSTSTNEATINWLRGGSETTWEVAYKPVTETTWNFDVASDTIHTLYGLTSATTYNVKVRAVCAPGDESLWTIAKTFTTQCEPFYDLPIVEDCETTPVNELPNCFSKLVSGSASVRVALDGTNKAVRMQSTSGDCFLILPVLVEPVNNIRLMFKYVSGADHIFKIGYLTNELDASSFVPIHNDIFGQSATGGSWKTFDIISSNVMTGTERIAIKFEMPTTYYALLDSITIMLQPECTEPTSLSLVNSGLNDATLSWLGTGSSYNLEYKAITETTWTPEQNVTAPHTIYGLLQNTAYQFRVQTICDGGILSEWSAPFTFSTLCGLITELPYVEDFETTAIDAIPNCFEKLVSGTASVKVLQSEGNLVLNMDAGSTSNNCFLILPATQDLVNTLRIMFKYYGGADHVLKIGYMTNSTNAASFVELHHVLLSTNGSWKTFDLTTNNTMVGNERIAIKFVMPIYYSIRIDSLTILQQPSCLPPFGLTATNVGAYEATLNWSVPTSSTTVDFNLEYKTTTETTWTLVPNVTSPYDLTTLLPMTNYQFRVQANCSASEMSDFSAPVSFTTQCAPLTPPTVSEPFAAMLPNACWARKSGDLPATGNATLTDITGSWVIRTTLGQNTAAVNMYSTSCKYWLITPSIDLGDGSIPYQLDFDLAKTAYYNANPGNLELSTSARFVVLISTDDGATWNSTGILKEWNNTTGTPFSSLNNTLQSQTIPVLDPITLVPYSGIVKFAFVALQTVTGWDNDIHMDNFQVNPYNSCERPTGISTTNIAPTSAQINWTETGTATSWEIEYGAPGFALGTGTIEYATTNPFVITNLTPLTAYQYYVVADCGAGSFSNYSISGTFTTLPSCPKPTAVTALDITVTSVELGWTEAGVATSWEIEYGPTGFIHGAGTIEQAGTNPYTISTLTNSTTYDFYVRALCSVDDSSEWSTKKTLSTPCLPTTLPFTENFDGATIPVCWSQTYAGGLSSNRWSISTGSNAGGTPNQMNNAYQDAIGISRLIAPAIDFTGVTDATLTFKYNYSDYAAGVTLKIQTSTDLATWTDQPFSIISGSGSVSATTATVALTLTSGVNYVAWVVDGDHYNFYNWYIDNVSIVEATASACTVPTGLAVSAITPNTATATWTAGGTETSWQIAYKTNAATTWTTQIVNAATYNFTALTASTLYNVKVRAICAPGDTSAYSAVVNFTTTNASCATPTNLAASAITPTGATITWTAGGTETSWELDYKLATASTWTTVTVSGTPSRILTGLTSTTNYNVRVRAVCTAGSLYSSYTTVVNFTTTTPPCVMPTNLQVTNITDQSANATWTPGGSETSWQVEYKLVSSANWTSATANVASFPMVGLQSASNYQVRVKAICGTTSESAFTAAVPFTTLGGTVTYTITATSGANGTITPTGAVTVNSGASQTFNFAANTGFIISAVVVDGTPEATQPTSYTFSNVVANHTIHVDFAVGIEENELAQLVELYPNPTTSFIELRMKSEQIQVKECKIYDMYGKLLRVLPIHSEITKIDVSDFASGVYFVRMDSERGTISKKFVKK